MVIGWGLEASDVAGTFVVIGWGLEASDVAGGTFSWGLDAVEAVVGTAFAEDFEEIIGCVLKDLEAVGRTGFVDPDAVEGVNSF